MHRLLHSVPMLSILVDVIVGNDLIDSLLHLLCLLVDDILVIVL
jgi:hypothetical protein